MTVLYAIAALAPIVGAQLVNGTMLPLVVQMAGDPVANVRLNAAQTLRQLVPLLDSAAVLERVKPCLSTMSTDRDEDVSYYAQQGLQAC